ncbi:MAG: hypothetical protein AAGB51_09615 [Planctomycetota bacterium]
MATGGSSDRPRDWRSHAPELRLTEDHDRVHDALADLFLGPAEALPDLPAAPDTQTPAPSIQTTAPEIEELVLGHLPGIAAAWAGQYARSVGSTTGAAALVSLRGGRISIELHGATDDETGGLTEDLPEALRRCAQRTHRWLIRTDEDDHAAGIDRLTLLSGCDDAAIVAAYRELKAISTAWTERGGPIPITIATPETPTKSGKGSKIDRLAQAAVAFLDAPADTVEIAGRLGGGRRSVVYDSVFDGTTRDVVAMIRANGVAAPGQIEAKPVPAKQRVLIEPESIPTEPAPISTPPLEPTPRTWPEYEPVAPSSAPIHASAITTNLSLDDLLTNPMPGIDEQPEPTPDPVTTLAEHIDGVMTVEVRCPFAADVEFAIDAEGTLHLLASAAGDEISARIEQLESARTWASENLSVLMLTSGLGSLRPDRAPAVHLFTDQPKRVRRLLSGPTRLYLLHETTTPSGERYSVCIELN